MIILKPDAAASEHRKQHKKEGYLHRLYLALLGGCQFPHLNPVYNLSYKTNKLQPVCHCTPISSFFFHRQRVVRTEKSKDLH